MESIGLFSRNVPHILQKIFFNLDYESYKKCYKVNRAWYELLISESYEKRAKAAFQEDIWREESNLCSAAEAGNVSKVRRFLSHLVDINCVRGVRDDTPLILAARGGHNAVIEILLDNGADPHKKNKYGLFPLGAAFRRLSSGLKYQAVKDEILSTVKVLLKGGASPNMASTKPRETVGGRRWIANIEIPIMAAPFYNDKDVLKVLLDAGANPNIKQLCPRGGTPLRLALFGSSIEIVKMLLEAGADPTMEDEEGVTPLTYAKFPIWDAFRRTNFAHHLAASLSSDAGTFNPRLMSIYALPLVHGMMSMAAYSQRRYKSGPLSPVPGF